MTAAPSAALAALELAPRFRARYVARNARLCRDDAERAAALTDRKRELDAANAGTVAAAIARAKARKAGHNR